ncbi:unnamed protein product [Pedinophyceae sp. YPF-701]|nr:unnamed protein product [Pedinophyceae sp. YPF-701]
MAIADGNVGVAFAMVIGAGASTILGACFVFYGKREPNRALLAGSLGASAGVMIYVSFVEIFAMKSFDYFESYGLTPEASQRYATLCFFGGMLFIHVLDKLVHLIANAEQDRPDTSPVEGPSKKAANLGAAPLDEEDPDPALVGTTSGVTTTVDAHDITRGVTPEPLEPKDPSLSQNVPCGNPACFCDLPPELVPEPSSSGLVRAKVAAWDELDDAERRRLNKMGVLTALAIGLHNFPEGLATFVAALADTQTGFVIAVAIALHNLPEGLCIAMPVYYATGSRWKGLMWAAISAVSEPLGGLLGYVVLANAFSDLAYAILFALVAGIMVFISLQEVIPNALQHDPEKKYVTYCCFGGMVVMAASLLCFQI